MPPIHIFATFHIYQNKSGSLKLLSAVTFCQDITAEAMILDLALNSEKRTVML